MKDIVSTLNDIQSGVGAARGIMDHSKAIAGHVDNLNAMSGQKSISLQVSGPATGYLKVPVLFEGTGYLPIKITSDGEYIRTITPNRGEFGTMLIFTKVGEYNVTFTMGNESKTLQISISKSKCPNCPD